MQSMTGFGRAEVALDSNFFTIEGRSVNHRYLDLRVRLPPALASLESSFAERVRSRFERGAFDITIKQKPLPSATGAGNTRFVVDMLAAKSLVECTEQLRREFKITGELSWDLFTQAGRVFVPIEEAIESEALLPQLMPLFDKMLDNITAMRQQEGREMARILSKGLEELETIHTSIRQLAVLQPERIADKLRARLKNWTVSEVDTQRLEWEVVLYAERSDITEEIDRLQAHIAEVRKLLAAPTSVGRKLDFLIQEMHREVNTMGSKAALVELTRLVVDAKTKIEKLREQAQNVE